MTIKNIKKDVKKMRNKFLMMLILLFLIPLVIAAPSPPTKFWGYGNIITGDLIEAYNSEKILCGKINVQDNGRYALDCSAYDFTTSENNGAVENEIIIFKINGQLAETSGDTSWNSGKFKQVDLSLKVLEENKTVVDNETFNKIPVENKTESEIDLEKNKSLEIDLNNSQQNNSNGETNINNPSDNNEANINNQSDNNETNPLENCYDTEVCENKTIETCIEVPKQVCNNICNEVCNLEVCEEVCENICEEQITKECTEKIVEICHTEKTCENKGMAGITGGVIGAGNMTVKWALYFIGIIFIIFITLKLFLRIKKINLRKSRNLKTIALILFIGLLSFNFVSAAQPPDCQMYSDAGGAIMDVWGINQNLAPIGAVITAYDPSGTLSGNFTVTTIGQFSMGIHGDDPGTGQDEGAVGGDVITFYINGDSTTAFGNVIWNSATFQKVNLTTDNLAPTISSISGLSGTILGGSLRTVSSISNDADHSKGTPDRVKIYVCKTNSATDFGGCVTGQTYCSSGLIADDPSCSFNVETDDTVHNYYVFVMDEHGRISTSSSGSYTTDSTPPVITTIIPANNSWTNDNTPSITVNTNENSQCKYSSSAGTDYASKTSMTGSSTSHTSTFSDMGADGTKYYYFQCNDSVGNLMNIINEYYYTIKLDTAIPTITDDYAYDNIWINTSTGDITFELEDTGGSGLRTDPAAMMYCVGIGCTPNINLSSPYEINYTLEQNKVVRYQSYDVAGSGSIIGNFTVKIDKSAPNTTDDYSYNDTWNNENANITILPSDLLASNLSINGSGVNWTKYCSDTDGTCTPDVIYPGGTINFTNDGTFYLRYLSSDNVNNSQDVQTVIIKIDKQNVSIVNASVIIENGLINITSTTLNFNYSGFEDQAGLSGIMGYYYSFINNQGTSTGIWDNDLIGILTGADQGIVNIFVWAKDIAGNIGLAVNDSIIVDSIAPNFTNWNNTAIITSDIIPMKIDVTIIEETSGINGLPTIRYKYGNDTWSADWINMSLVTGKNYTFSIPNPMWYDYYNKNIYWQVNAIDIAGNSANSLIQSYLIGSGEPEPIVIKKNIEYKNQTDFKITYLVTDSIYNTLNDTDMTGVIYADSDINATQQIFSLIKGEIKIKQIYLVISKDAMNKDYTFATASAIWNSYTFISNTPSISIPGYGGPFDIEVDVPASVEPSTSITGNIKLINMNLDVSKDVVVEYWITDTENNTIGGTGQKTVLANSLQNTSTTGSLTSPSNSGNYRFWARVTWVLGMTAEAYDSFTIGAVTPITPPSSGGGGGGGGGGGVAVPKVIIPEVPTYLFDIKFELDSTKIKNSNELSSIITFTSFGNVPTPVDLTYSILDSSGAEVYSEKGNVTVTTKQVVRKKFENLNLPSGKYILVLTTIYGNNIKDEFGQGFEVGEAEVLPLLSVKNNGIWFIILIFVIIMLFIIVIIIYRKRKKKKDEVLSSLEIKIKHLQELKIKREISNSVYHKEKERLLQKINNLLKNKQLMTFMGVMGIMVLLFSFFKTKTITGGAINTNFIGVTSSGFILLMIIIIASFISLSRLIIKGKSKESNRLKDIIGKEVYAENGDKIGKIEEVYLENHRIYGWLIKVDKKIVKKILKNNILIKHKYVKSIGKIMIIKENIAEHLEKII